MGTRVKTSSGKWRAVVRLMNQSDTKTFDTAAQADAWMEELEAQIRKRAIIYKGHTLGSMLDRYRIEVELAKSYGTQSAKQINRFAVAYAAVDLAECTEQWWFDQASGWDVQPTTRLTYLARIRGVLDHANTVWDVPVDFESFNRSLKKLRKAKLVKAGRSRKRRITPAEVIEIKRYIRSEMPMGDIIDFALLTCMRRAEICRIKWTDLTEGKAPMIWVRDRKHPRDKIGNDDNVPLLGNALDIIKRQPRIANEPRIFPFVGDSISFAFSQGVLGARLADVVFHDTRHEGISRLFDDGYQIEEVALVSGHKSWETLRGYTHIKPERLHQGPISQRERAPLLRAVK